MPFFFFPFDPGPTAFVVVAGDPPVVPVTGVLASPAPEDPALVAGGVDDTAAAG